MGRRVGPGGMPLGGAILIAAKEVFMPNVVQSRILVAGISRYLYFRAGPSILVFVYVRWFCFKDTVCFLGDLYTITIDWNIRR
jgi:hypothetical protein